MPVWLYSLGRIFTNATNIYIPFVKLIMNLFTTIGPCIFGLCLLKCFPKIKPIVLKIAKPITLFTLLSFLGLTIYVKYYVFYLFTWQLLVFPPLVPWCGLAISALVAFIARLERKQIYTIAIETTIQNVGIAFMIVLYNFPSPDADYAILPLISASLLTNLPLYVMLIIVTIIKKCKNPRKNKVVIKSTIEETEEELEELNENKK